jgi:hypothetical protein
MDTLSLAIIALVGFFAMGYAALRPKTSGLARAFAMGLGMPWLLIFFVLLMWRTGPTAPFEWTGQAEMGPLTLVLILAGVCWLWFGADYDELHHDDNAGF